MKRFIHQNYGFAFSLERACQIAIQRGNKGFGSIRTKQMRIQYFTEFLKTSGIKDLRKVRYADLQSFGEHVAQLATTQRVLAISRKKAPETLVPYLSQEATRHLLA